MKTGIIRSLAIVAVGGLFAALAWRGFQPKESHREMPPMTYERMEEIYERITEDYPEFLPARRELPPVEENGYERLRALSESDLAKISGGDRDVVDACLSHDRTEWRIDEAREVIERHPTLLDEAYAIGELTQSVRDWRATFEAMGFLEISPIKHVTDLLLCEARVAAIDGSRDRYERAMGTTLSIARHLDAVAEVTLLDETVAILIRSGVAGQLLEDLQLFDFDEPMRQRMMAWMRSQPSMTSDGWFVDLIKDEYVVSVQCLALPLLGGNVDDFDGDLNITDADQLERVMKGYLAGVRGMLQIARGNHEGPQQWVGDGTDYLELRQLRQLSYSEVRWNEREIMDTLVDVSFFGIQSFADGVRRAEASRQCHLAALMLCGNGALPEDPKAVVEAVAAEFGNAFELIWLPTRKAVMVRDDRWDEEVIVEVPLRG